MEPMRARLAWRSRSGLRGLMGLAAAALLLVQGVKAMSESGSARGNDSDNETKSSATASAADAGPCRGPGSSSLSWWNAVLEEEPADASTPTWWDVMLYESSR